MSSESPEPPLTTSLGWSLSLSPLADVRGNLAATVGESLINMLAMFFPPALCKKANVVVTELVQNVIDNVAKLKSAAPILNAAVEQGKLKVVGGIYRLTTGTVELIAQG